MRYIIVYWSRYGNGKKIVDYLSEKLKIKGEIQIFKTSETDPATMPEADLYIFSAPAEAFNVQKNVRNFMKKLEGTEGKKYGIINTHSMKNKNWLHKMEKLLSKKKMIKVADAEFQVGDGFRNGNGLMLGWEEKLDEFAGKI